ncbi:MAG: hypothetical protein LBJ38_01805 [Oscillospiraceae bacterium]|jgi:hypothetical protein|nr:hypothetical protein [Oscillospiraceae bacterium]
MKNKGCRKKDPRAARAILIHSVADFLKISKYPYAYYELATDLDMEGLPMISLSRVKFRGILDGNGKTIKNLKIRDHHAIRSGLFGLIEAGATIKNLHLNDISVTGMGSVGVIAGENKGNIVGCTVSDALVQGYYTVGVIAGSNSRGGQIKNCVATGTALGNIDIGGIVGNNLVNARITNCIYGGKLCGIENVGGISGQNHGEIAFCHSQSEIKSQKIAGKLVGLNRGNVKLNGSGCLQQHYNKVLIFSELVGRNWVVL